ncbi:short-chain dehydrogenase/reductase [Neptunitalea chrysea]|uniref:Short-chain dehydrogenase/reductase n=1 Tax=Neptunitalea chrysea TaxID=1647581 RepID=A0A9W6B6Z7_9FLAO|nr:SDR family oxidoreductase [Neptunitalea chrysea]GLB52967.1 short-chain dehydrogenase/reductase [Neptunitalea chrysea]
MKKVVVITGTSTGLGLETAILFAKQNFTVYATMRNLAKQDLLLAAAKTNNVIVQVLPLEVTSITSITSAITTIVEKEGRIDVFINNAGAGFAKTTEQATEEEVDWVLDVNFKSVVRCVKAVLPVMRAQKSGHIINISSVGGLVGQPFNELYCAAKFAVEGYTEAMATYLPQNFGIHFTAVEPGGIATEFTKSATEKTLGTTGLPQDNYLPIIQQYIGKRQERAAAGNTPSFQTATEVAEVVLQVAQTSTPPIRIRTSAWAEVFCNFKTEKDPNGLLQNQAVIESMLGSK